MLSLRVDPENELAERILAEATRQFVESGVARGEVADAHRPEILADIFLGAIKSALSRWCTDPAYDLAEGLAETSCALLDLSNPRRNPS